MNLGSVEVNPRDFSQGLASVPVLGRLLTLRNHGLAEIGLA